MSNPILVTRSSMPSYEEYCEEIKDMWETHWLTNMGPKHKKLQSELIQYLDVENIDLMTNGHMALELSLQALNLEGEVITTPFTFASTTHAIVRNGLPVIVKPVDSSGSKGATVLRDWSDLQNACNFAFSYSRSHRIIIEEFIEKKHKYLIGGDIFVYDGKVILWGLLNCHRDINVNPLVPVGKSYPLLLDEQDKAEVQKTLQSMINKLGIRFGSVNVELVVDKFGKVWPIDVGPRAGGNMIPDLLGLIFGVDVVEMAVLTSMGETIENKVHKAIPYYATHNLHTNENGVYKTIKFSKELEKKIIKKCIYKNPGDKIEYFDNAAKALGIIFMKFDDEIDMDNILCNINSLYKVVVE